MAGRPFQPRDDRTSGHAGAGNWEAGYPFLSVRPMASGRVAARRTEASHA